MLLEVVPVGHIRADSTASQVKQFFGINLKVPLGPPRDRTLSQLWRFGCGMTGATESSIVDKGHSFFGRACPTRLAEACEEA
jgi:hypothetical protein